MTIPSDYMVPDWDNAHRVHDWKNHVPQHVRDIWTEFTDAHQKALAEWAEALADAEEWD